MPRLPNRRPRAGVTMISPNGVTRFWSGTAARDSGSPAAIRSASARACAAARASRSAARPAGGFHRPTEAGDDRKLAPRPLGAAPWTRRLAGGHGQQPVEVLLAGQAHELVDRHEGPSVLAARDTG